MLETLIVGGVAAVLDSTIVAIDVHTLVSELHTTVSTIQWVSTGYLLALAVAIPLVGWGQVRFGCGCSRSTIGFTAVAAAGSLLLPTRRADAPAAPTMAATSAR
ncbi:hypothetical protein [Cellulomonas hominis]